jgi:hypothetical protein
MELNIELHKNIKIENIKFQKMLFIFNAVNDGWSVKKEDTNYIFTKDHNGKKEIFKEEYLGLFMNKHFDINKLLEKSDEK